VHGLAHNSQLTSAHLEHAWSGACDPAAETDSPRVVKVVPTQNDDRCTQTRRRWLTRRGGATYTAHRRRGPRRPASPPPAPLSRTLRASRRKSLRDFRRVALSPGISPLTRGVNGGIRVRTGAYQRVARSGWAAAGARPPWRTHLPPRRWHGGWTFPESRVPWRGDTMQLRRRAGAGFASRGGLTRRRRRC